MNRDHELAALDRRMTRMERVMDRISKALTELKEDDEEPEIGKDPAARSSDDGVGEEGRSRNQTVCWGGFFRPQAALTAAR